MQFSKTTQFSGRTEAVTGRIVIATLLAVLAGCGTQSTRDTEPAESDIAPILDTSDERGACIGATAQYETCTYAIAVFGPEATPRLIVSRKLESTKADGQPVWHEQDRLNAPALPPGGALEFSTCRQNGTPDDTIVALLPIHDETSPEYIKAAGWAYRIELPSGRFNTVDAASIDCINNATGAE